MAERKRRIDVNYLKDDVLEQIFYKDQSRKALIEYFNVRPNTISRVISELKNEGKIVGNQIKQTGGRPLVLFKINNKYKYYGGIMLEGERIQGTVIGFAGEIVHSCLKHNPQDISRKVFIDNLKYVIKDLLKNTPDGKLDKIRMCGEYFSDDGRYFSTGYLEKEDPIDVLTPLEKEFDVEFSSGSGIGAMVMAERIFGKGRTVDNFLYVHFGAGILAGIVDSRIGVREKKTVVGELGHTRNFSNKQCRCGRTGCLETVASVWAIKDYLKENPDILTKDQWIHLDNLAVSDILSIYLFLVKKNEKVVEHLRYMSGIVGIAIRNILDLVTTRPVIFSGTMLEAADIIIPEIKKEFAKTILPFEKQPVQVMISDLDMYAPSLGAAMFLLAEEIMSYTDDAAISALV